MTVSFRALRVDHTGITVRDIEASIAVWRDVFGFELLYRSHKEGAFAAEVTGVPDAEILMAVLQGFGHKIELLQYLAPAQRATFAPSPCDLGSWHLALDVDDLDAAVTELRRLGWTIPGAPHVIEGGGRAGTRVVYARDPDGSTVELMQPPG